ncbi:winged helix DNA-binding domain-containing protein [Actinomadura kijaniata]|uniref:winged helix DNA-binding domain-containing protein n=1 Tax=Actinomadura kijaniata TaxID=46161 RepID=UPI003F1BB044
MDVLDRRTLNRAALDRQLLLARSDMSALDAVARVVGVQAQDPNVPYHCLWARLAGFRQEDLTALFHDRSIVRSSFLRGTQHIATADDFLWMRTLVQPAVLRTRQAGFGRVTADWDLDELAAAARQVLAGRTLTRPQVARALAERWPDRDLLALGWSVQALVPVVHPPPSGTWNTWGATPFALVEDWTGRPLDHDPRPDELIRRYLAAFGPGSVKDFQAWSGMRRMDGDFDRMRGELRVYRDENGVELFDLPDAGLPDPGVPAPVRFLPDLDNLLLAYHDRTRVMTVEQRKVVCVGAWVKATMLVDGRVRGVWRIERDKRAARSTLCVELFEPLRDTSEAEAEGARLLAFTAPDDEHDIRFAPLER